MHAAVFFFFSSFEFHSLNQIEIECDVLLATQWLSVWFMYVCECGLMLFETLLLHKLNEVENGLC